MHTLDDDYRRLFFSGQMVGDYEAKYRNMITVDVLFELAARSSFIKVSST